MEKEKRLDMDGLGLDGFLTPDEGDTVDRPKVNNFNVGDQSCWYRIVRSVNQPTEHDPSRGDRLIAIDPGNRDMVVAVNVTTKKSETEVFRLSTKQHLHETMEK